MKKSGKRLLSLLMTAAMLLSLLPAMTGGAAAESVAIDVANVTSAGTGYTYETTTSGSKVIKITSGGTYDLSGTSTAANIIVDSTSAVTLNLKGVDITAGDYTQSSVYKNSMSTGTAAISIQGNTNCTLTLADGTTNTLKGHANKDSVVLHNSAAISVENTFSSSSARLASLTINGTGTLTATGAGQCAAIGGNINRATGNITIVSGTIYANGGDWSAGIGDGDSLNNNTDYLKWCCDAADATSRSISQTCSHAAIAISGGYIKTVAGQSTPGIGTSDQLSNGSASNESGFTGRVWTGLTITVSGGTVIAEGGTNNLTAIGAGKSTVISPADIIINKGARVLAVTVAQGFPIHNDGVNTAAAAPQISSASTANVFSYKFDSTGAAAKDVDFYELSGTTPTLMDGFPNNELDALKKPSDKTANLQIYGLAVVLPDGSYQMKNGDKTLAEVTLDGGGMVYGDGSKGTLYTVAVTPYKDDNKWSDSGKSYTLGTTSGSTTTYFGTAVTSGTTYKVYELSTNAAGGAVYTDTGVSIAVSDTNRAARVNYYTLTLNKDEGVSSVTGAGTYLSGTSVVLGAALNQYYTWQQWTSGTTGVANITSQTGPVTVTTATTLTAATLSNRAPVTITGVTVAGKTYDGTAVAYTGTPTAADGSGQTASIDSYTYQWQKSDGTVLTDAPKDAGSYKLVVSVPSDNAGYSGSTSIPFTISPKPVTITGLTANNKIYDGGLSAVPAGTAAIDGRVGNDDLTVTAGTAAFADKNVGTGKAVSFSGYALGGTAAGNYTLSAQPAGTTADITAKPVTVSGISASDKAYDGKTDATLTYGSVTITGKDSGDTVTVSAAGAFANADAGQDKTVNISDITLGGADAGNYKLAESGQQATTTANITAAAVTLTGVTVPGKIYDGKAVVPNTSALIVSGGTVDTATLVYTYYKNTGTAETPVWTKLDAAPKDAGTYKLVVSVPGSNADYSGSAEIPFTVAPAPVTITVANKNVLVGDAAPSLANPAAGTDYTVTGLVGSDTLTTAPTLAYSPAPDLSKAGSCAITASGASAGGNYAITSVNGTLTVTAAAPKNYTVSFDPNGGTLAAGTAAQTVTENLKLTRPADPTREGYTFLGWYRDKSGTTAWDFDTTGVTGAATLYAKWAQKTYSVSGSVTDSGNNAVSDAVVTVVQGTKEFMRTATGSDGSYTFTGVAPGVYNVVAVKDGVTKTILVTITNGDMGNQNIQMPAGKVNSVLEVTGSDTPNVVVGGLEKQADKVKADNSEATDVVVKMTVEEKPENAVTANDVTAIKEEAAKTTTNTNLEYIDIAVKQTVTETKDGKTESHGNSDIHETNAILEIVVPYDTTGKTDITVYRNHTADSEGATTFTKLASRHEEEAGRQDKTFYVDTANNRIYVYAQKFSTYAISYKTADAGTGTGTGGSASAGGSGSAGSTRAAASVAVADTAGGAVSVSTVQPAPGSTVTITVKPETGRQISTVTVTDESGKSVAVTQNSDGTYTYTQPAGKVSVKAVFRTIPADPSATGVSKLLQTADHIVYLHGYPDASFGPERSMTRAEAAQMFYNLLLNREAGGTAGFTDVSADAWYKTAVDTLASLKIIEGVGGNAFAPERAVTRAEFTAMAMRFAALTTGGTNAFSDVSKTDWFYDEVVGSEKYGWITGYSDGSFKPNATITRAEVTTIVNRMLGRSADTAFVDANAARLRTFPDTASSYWAYYDIAEATNAHEYTKTNGTESWKS